MKNKKTYKRSNTPLKQKTRKRKFPFILIILILLLIGASIFYLAFNSNKTDSSAQNHKKQQVQTVLSHQNLSRLHQLMLQKIPVMLDGLKSSPRLNLKNLQICQFKVLRSIVLIIQRYLKLLQHKSQVLS